MINIRQNILSSVYKNIIWKYIIKAGCTSDVIFLWYITEKKRKILNYCIEEWHTSTPYNIFWNQSTSSTVYLLLETWHRIYHCIVVCGKWIFYSNLKVALTLTQVFLNYICRGNDTDEIKFVGVLHAILAVPPEVFQRRLNIK